MDAYKFTIGTIEYKSDENGIMIPDSKKETSDVIVKAVNLKEAIALAKIVYGSIFSTPRDINVDYYVKSVEALNGM